jgi:hypothetical protein
MRRGGGSAVSLMAVGFASLVSWRLAAQSSDKLVYADFEQLQEGRPVSVRGGQVLLTGYSENTHRPPVFKGIAGLEPPAPELVRTKPDDPNHMAKFEFELLTPNQWSGVILQIKGQPEKDGKAVADDVSGYKTLSMDVFVTGVKTMRVELVSKGYGFDMDDDAGYPQVTFLPKQGLGTYRVALKTFAQPEWVKDTRVDPKDILKKLTAVNISAYCDECRPTKGMVVIDNVVFEK